VIQPSKRQALLLNVPWHALGLKASPKGWYCGDLQITYTMPNGQETRSDGAPIDSLWVQLCHEEEQPKMHQESMTFRNFQVSKTAAKCILVVEKEGIYNRLAEDRFYDVYPCIMITAKGFPDLSSRAMVYYLHQHLGLPVWGLCDCNPFGILVMHTYFRGSIRRGQMDGGARFGVPIQWMGLRPSQVEALTEASEEMRRSGDTMLPPQVFQEFTPLDRKRLKDTLMGDFGFEWTGCSERRMEELELMSENGYKVELEALHWMVRL
jgi:meiotic recombination protein SPO11